MTHAHAVVWLDHHLAKVIQFSPEASETRKLKHPGNDRRQEYYKQVASALRGVQEILVCGPGAAKAEFVKHLGAHDPTLSKAVLGVESADHPTEGQMLAHARAFFKGKDRMIAH